MLLDDDIHDIFALINGKIVAKYANYIRISAATPTSLTPQPLPRQTTTPSFL